MESGKSLPASSAAEAALREHFSGEEGDKAVQQQVCSHLHCRPLCELLKAVPGVTRITQQAATAASSRWACLYRIAVHTSTSRCTCCRAVGGQPLDFWKIACLSANL